MTLAADEHGDNSMESVSVSSNGQEETVGMLDILILLAKHKKLVLGLPLVAAMLAVGITLLMPNIYTATTRILPPQQAQSTAASMLGQLGALAGAATGALGIKNPNDLYVGMLKSRTVADNLIQRFKLRELYETDTQVETRKALENLSFIDAGKDGIISIEVEDKDPKRAAEMANAYVEELYKLTQTLAVTEASQRRLFFERQLKSSRDNLAAAEVALKETQQKTGVLALEEQGKASIEAAATLRAHVAAKEVELAAMRAYATEQNPALLRVSQELAGLRSQLARFERGSESGALQSVGKLPEAGLEYLRRVRDLKYHETVYELLAKQFEIAKVDEAKDASIIQVLDKAMPPDRKSKPKRALIVLLTLVLTGLLSIFWVFIREAHARAESQPDQAARLQALRQYLRG